VGGRWKVMAGMDIGDDASELGARG
jgi:hypothetical protein